MAEMFIGAFIVALFVVLVSFLKKQAKKHLGNKVVDVITGLIVAYVLISILYFW